jgi:rod shape-determining protein MreD
VIPTPGGILRVAGLVFFAVILQISGFGDIRVLGGNADLVPLIVAAIALFTGSLSGAIAGFSAGLLLDLAIGQHLGASSLVLTAMGYWVGRYREIRDPAHGLIPVPVAAVATLGYVVGMAAVSFMLEIDANVSPVVFREMLMTVVLNSLLALPFFALVRRVLRPVLAVDPSERRRRQRMAPETGPIGLRGLDLNP